MVTCREGGRRAGCGRRRRAENRLETASHGAGGTRVVQVATMRDSAAPAPESSGAATSPPGARGQQQFPPPHRRSASPARATAACAELPLRGGARPALSAAALFQRLLFPAGRRGVPVRPVPGPLRPRRLPNRLCGSPFSSCVRWPRRLCGCKHGEVQESHHPQPVPEMAQKWHQETQVP